jgi:hypothetical protein
MKRQYFHVTTILFKLFALHVFSILISLLLLLLDTDIRIGMQRCCSDEKWIYILYIQSRPFHVLPTSQHS